MRVTHGAHCASRVPSTALPGEVLLVYELRTSGMAGGPVSKRLWVGFDLARGTT